MAAISLMIEGQQGLTWKRWSTLVEQAETLGFAGLFRSDHFTDPVGPPEDSLEMLVSLAHVAERTQRIHFGPLVAPFSFRDPVMLARQAAALDDLSNGRMILGVGAGWQDREHDMFGYHLGDIKTRMVRFEEGLEVITRLLRSTQPTTFDGHVYRLRDAVLLPHPTHAGGPRILIGGNGMKRTLPLAARYADIWNGVFISPEAFKERSEALDTLTKEAGREPSSLKRTAMITLIYARDEHELAQLLQKHRLQPELANLSLAEASQYLVAHGHAIAGTAEQVRQHIQTYLQAGAEEMMLQWLDQTDTARLQDFAHNVLNRL